VQSCQRSTGNRAFLQQVWQYLLMSVTAFAVGAADGLADARLGDAASAPSTTATIIWRELGLEGRNRRMRKTHAGNVSIAIISTSSAPNLALASEKT